MKKKNQLKGTVLDRRRFLLKSAGAAGALSAPAISRAEWWSVFIPPNNFGEDVGNAFEDIGNAFEEVVTPIVEDAPQLVDEIVPVLNPEGIKSPGEIVDDILDLLPDELRYATNPVHINTIKAADDPLFYKLMEDSGIGGWDICEARWQNSQDAMTKFGYLSFINEGNSRLEFATGPFGGEGSMRHLRDIKAKYKFNFHEFYNQSGHKDLDRIKIDKVNIDGLWNTNTNIVDTTFSSELRRKLPADPGWGDDWQIPDSWQAEFELWATSIDRESGYPAFGVFVMQWGARQRWGIGFRHIIVYRYNYLIVDGVWRRRAASRRMMYLFGAYVEPNGGGLLEWRNFAMDNIRAADVDLINIIGEGFFRMYGLEHVYRGMPLAAVNGQWPQLPPMPFNMDVLGEFAGWNNALAGQRARDQAAIIAAVREAVRGGRGDAQFLAEAMLMRDALLGLALAPRNVPENIGVVPFRHRARHFRDVDVLRIDGEPLNINQAVVRGVQFAEGPNPRHFGRVNPINPALNNFWRNGFPPRNFQGVHLWELVPEDVLQYPAGAGVDLGIPPNVAAGDIVPNVNMTDVIPNGLNLDEFSQDFRRVVFESNRNGFRKNELTTLMTIIND